MRIEELSKRYTLKEIDSLSHRDLYDLWIKAKDVIAHSDWAFNQFNARCDSIFAENGKEMIDLLWRWGGAHDFFSNSFNDTMSEKIQMVLNAVKDPALVFVMIARPANGTIVIPVRKVATSEKQPGFYGDVRISNRPTYWPLVRSAIRRYLISEKTT